MFSGASDDAADAAQKNKCMRQGTQIIFTQGYTNETKILQCDPRENGTRPKDIERRESHGERENKTMRHSLSLSLSEITQCKSVYKLRRKRKCIHHSAAAMPTERERASERERVRPVVALHCQKLPCPMLDTPTKVDGAALTHTHTCEACPAHTHTCIAYMEWHIMSCTASWP